MLLCLISFFFCKQKTAYELRICDWSSVVCSSDLLERFSGLPGRRCISHDEYHVDRGIVLAIAVERRVAAGASMDDGVGHAGASQAVAFLSPGRIRKIEEGFVSRIPDRENLIDMLSAHG